MTPASYRLARKLGEQAATAGQGRVIVLNSTTRTATYAAPQQVIFGVFGTPERAGAMRKALRESEQRSVIRIVSLTLIKRDRDGRLELLEAGNADRPSKDSTGPFSAILRLMLGATPHTSSSARLYALAGALSPGTSAIAALIEHRWIQDIRAVMEEAGAESVAAAMRAEIAAALAAQRDLVLTAGSTDLRTVEMH